MGPGPAEPLVDPVRADGAIARVHLRPWQEAGLDPAPLLEAFLATAGAWREVPGELEKALRQAGDWAADLGLAADAVTALAGRMHDEGYPAVHHSEAYCLHYRPAYRVVANPLAAGRAGGGARPSGRPVTAQSAGTARSAAQARRAATSSARDTDRGTTAAASAARSAVVRSLEAAKAR